MRRLKEWRETEQNLMQGVRSKGRKEAGVEEWEDTEVEGGGRGWSADGY